MVITGVTYRCNFNCLFCLDMSHKRKNDLSMEEIKHLFKTIIGRNEDTIMLMTGESFIRPDFLKILEEAKKCNLKLKVTTNGSMLSYYDFLVKVIKGGITQINFSLHSHIPKVANAISRNSSCYSLQQKALLNIDSFNANKKMGREKLCINFNTVVSKLNYKELDALAIYLKNLLKHTPFRIKFKFMDLVGNDIGRYKMMLPSFHDVGPHLLNALKVMDNNKVGEEISTCGFPLCILSPYEWSSVELKENLYHNNLYLNSCDLNNIRTQHDTIEDGFCKHKGCEDCSLREICPGIRRDYLKAYPDFNVSPSCKDVKEILRVLGNIAIFDSEIRNNFSKYNY